MGQATIRNAIDCSEQDYFEKCLFSEDYTKRLYLEVLKMPGVEVLEMKKDGDVWSRRVQIQPTLTGLPGPVTKLVGDKFSYIEEGKYDTKTKRFKFNVLPSTAADKTKASGEMWCETEGGKTYLCAKLDVEVKIFVVGGMVEDKILGDFKASMGASAPFIGQFVKGG